MLKDNERSPGVYFDDSPISPVNLRTVGLIEVIGGPVISLSGVIAVGDAILESAPSTGDKLIDLGASILLLLVGGYFTRSGFKDLSKAKEVKQNLDQQNTLD